MACQYGLVSVIIAADAVRRYVGKYAAKHEEKSAALSEALRDLVAGYVGRDMQHVGPLSVFHRLPNRVLVERDYTAQEVSWLCLGGSLVRCDLKPNFVTLHMDGAARVAHENGRVVIKDTPITRYAN